MNDLSQSDSRSVRQQAERNCDFETAEEFLLLLGKDLDKTRLRAFSHKATPKSKKLSARKFGFDRAAIAQAQADGLGIYAVINDGGDTKNSITKCRAYFAEFDGIPTQRQWETVEHSKLPKPSFVVETGGGSLHFYWVLRDPVTDKHQWQADTKRLITHLCSDKSVNDPSRVMRLPGCWYMGSDGTPIAQVEIVHQSDVRYTREQILGSLPEPEDVKPAAESPTPSICRDIERTEQRAIEQLLRIPSRVPGTGTRETYLRLLWGLVAITGPERAAQLMTQHSPDWAAQEDLAKITNDANGSISSATFFEIAKAEWGITSPKSADGYPEEIPEEIKQCETIDDLLGPVQEGKLRRPRVDILTKVLQLTLPLHFNLLTPRIENAGQAIDGDFLGTLYIQLAEKFQIEAAKERVIDAAILLARRNSYHPVREYLNGICCQLQTHQWEEIAYECFGVSTPSAQMHLQRALIGCVARAIKPGCKLDTALVIHSPQQGIGKSTFWAELGGEWFSDSLGDLRNLKDDVLQLHSAWIHEWGEIDAVVGKRESETLKKFLSTTRDDIRKPYGRGVETLHRCCAIVGTTNRSDFIKDPTGNRRFPVISVETVNLDWVKTNRDRIWGSALAAFKAGTPWHYSEEENAAISQAAQRYAAEDPLRDQIETWIEDHPEIKEVPVVRIVFDLDRDKLKAPDFSRQVSLKLIALGWQKSSKRERGYLPNGDRHDRATFWHRPSTAPALPHPTAQ